MTRYVKGYTGPMKPAAGPRGGQAPTSGPGSAQQPFTGPKRRPEKPATGGTKPAGYGVGRPTVSGIPKPAPSGPMVPVRGGGMAPQSAAYTMKKGGTTTLHSITKSSKKSNW